MHQKIAITALSSISSLGQNTDEVWRNYLSENHFLSFGEIGNKNVWFGKLSTEIYDEIEQLKNADSKYKSLDNSVLFAILSARNAVKQAGWHKNDNFGVNIGSSRGATKLFEDYYKVFLETGLSHTLTSPTTTLGNISSWVAHDLQTFGPEISHAITCSTSLHSLLNGVAWLKSGMASKFLVGGSEAPLTGFTLAQMHALKIYTRASETEHYPCQAGNLSKMQNTLVLGEGAAMCCLEINNFDRALAFIEGVGYATEILENSTSISTEATCFQKSMKMALGTMSPSEIDAIVLHTPGTIKGDLSELNAVEAVFNNHEPLLTNNKWKMGHTFGTSGILSVEMAVLMLQNQMIVGVPFLDNKTKSVPLRKIMVNAVGFGGNAVSIIVGK